MKYQLLVSTMNQTDHSICEEMKIDSDALFINQSDYVKYEHFKFKKNNIDFHTYNEKGVGLSRNNALMRSDADIIEFADDDMIFIDGYKEKVMKEFLDHPEADAIVFSIDSLNPDRPMHKISKFGRVRKTESIKYGCARLAIRRNRVIYNNIYFSLLFGGGAKYGCGEDTVFLNNIIKAGLKLYKSPIKVADIKQETSTWFYGYSDKYYFDKGALIQALYPKFSEMLALGLAFVHSRFSFSKFRKLYRNYNNGINDFKRNC